MLYLWLICIIFIIFYLFLRHCPVWYWGTLHTLITVKYLIAVLIVRQFFWLHFANKRFSVQNISHTKSQPFIDWDFNSLTPNDVIFLPHQYNYWQNNLFLVVGLFLCYQSSLHTPLVAVIPPSMRESSTCMMSSIWRLTCTMRFFWKSDKNRPFHCVYTNMACMIKFHWELWWGILCCSAQSATVLIKNWIKLGSN